MANPEHPFSPEHTSSSEEPEMPKVPQEKKPRSLKSKLKEVIEGRPVRKDLASRETVNIGGKELRAGDTVFTFNKKTGEPIPHRIKYWDDTGVVLQHRDTDSMGLKERLLGGADEWQCSWDSLESLSLEPIKP